MSKSTIPHGPGRECCRSALSWESTHVNVVTSVLLSESNMGPSRPKYIGSGQRVHSTGRIWEILWKCDIVGVSPHSTGRLSGPRNLYVIRPRMTGRKGWVIIGPFSWLRYFIHYPHRSTFGRRIQETLKRGRGESERAREKEMKRRRERGTGAVDSSNREWQDNGSKNMSWCKVDIPQLG